MTEITEKIVSPFYPVHRAPRYAIDPVAFFLALIGGPVLFTLATFWIFLIPVFALVLGGPAYLAVGAPLLLWTMRHREPNTGEIAGLACMSVFGLCAVIAIAVIIADETTILFGLFLFGACGLIFAPLWAVCFCRIYLKLRRDIYARQVF